MPVTVQLFHGHAQAQKLRAGKDAVVPEIGDVGEQLLPAHGVELCHVQVADPDLQGAHGLEHALLQDWSRCP